MCLFTLAYEVIFTRGYELVELEMCEKQPNPSRSIIPPDKLEKDGGDEPQAPNNYSWPLLWLPTTRQLL